MRDINSSNKESRQIFISYAREDLDEVEKLYKILKESYYEIWFDQENILPGQDWQKASRSAIQKADIFLTCISKNSISRRGYFQKELQIALDFIESRQSSKIIDDIFVIPILLEPCQIPDQLRLYQAVNLYESDGYDLLLKGLESIYSAREKATLTLKEKSTNFQIAKISLKNIRCFESLEVDLLNSKNNPITWAMIIGDNASGKSTLLRGISIGLCNESDATALISDVPGRFIRDGADEGEIEIWLVDVDSDISNERYKITTWITHEGQGEVIRKKVEPENFPWSNVFVCGYGTNRSHLASQSIETYSPRFSLRTLFDYNASLQNPELTLLKLRQDIRENIERKILRILMLDPDEFRLFSQESTLELRGPWGNISFDTLSDGYRSTFQWVLDFLGWMIFAGRLTTTDIPGGILLIDEIEQHLHPRWQRYIVQQLRAQFPNSQIFSTTHTPLVASGIVDIENGLIGTLSQGFDGEVQWTKIDHEYLNGKRADQVLATIFEVPTSRNPGSQSQIDRYLELLHKKNKLSPRESDELLNLKDWFNESFTEAESLISQKFRKCLDDFTKSRLMNISPEIVDAEMVKVFLDLNNQLEGIEE